jgi:hypothetical protein
VRLAKAGKAAEEVAALRQVEAEEGMRTRGHKGQEEPKDAAKEENTEE